MPRLAHSSHRARSKSNVQLDCDNAHPILIMHLKHLFLMILIHAFVPDRFGIGISIPLLKDKTGNVNDVDNYRAITLSPVISKLFEAVLITVCGMALNSDPLQFGF